MPCVMIEFTFTTFRYDYVSNLSTLSLMVRQHPVRNNCTTATMPEILLWQPACHREAVEEWVDTRTETVLVEYAESLCTYLTLEFSCPILFEMLVVR